MELGGINLLDLGSRWLHVGSVVVLVGGTVFLRFVLLPAARLLPDDVHASLRVDVLGRWKRFVHTLILLLIATGIWNLMARLRPNPPVAAYHMVFGVKVLLALFVFFVASALVGRSKGMEPLRAQAPRWLLVNVLVAAVILLLSVTLRFLPAR